MNRRDHRLGCCDPFSRKATSRHGVDDIAVRENTHDAALPIDYGKETAAAIPHEPRHGR